MKQKRTLPSIATLSCVVLTAIGLAGAMQFRASRRLGIPWKFHWDHLRMLMLDQHGADQPGDRAAPNTPGDYESGVARLPFGRQTFVEYRNLSFTDQPILFFGDSQLQQFCDCELVTQNPKHYFRLALSAKIAMRYLERLRRDADIVILHIGFVDMISDPSGDRLVKGYREILEMLKEKKILVLLPEALNEHAFPAEFRQGLDNRRLQSVRKRLAALCATWANVRTVDISPYVVDSAGNVDARFCADYMHFNGEGFDILWKLIRTALHGWVQERRPERDAVHGK